MQADHYPDAAEDAEHRCPSELGDEVLLLVHAAEVLAGCRVGDAVPLLVHVVELVELSAEPFAVAWSHRGVVARRLTAAERVELKIGLNCWICGMVWID